MKKYLLIPIFFFTTIIFPQSGWYWQNPYPTGLPLQDIEAVSVNEFVLVGNAGTILKYDHSGNWIQLYNAPSKEDIYFTGVDFINANKGFAVGLDIGGSQAGTGGWLVICSTTDGGTTWTEYRPNIRLDGSINPKIKFANEYLGTILPTLMTTDGGLTWIPRNISFPGEEGDITFNDNNIGITVSGSYSMDPDINRSTDGGLTWTSIANGYTFTLYGVCFADSTTLFAVGSSGAIIKSTNTGLNWSIISSGVTNHLHSVSFINKDTGTVVGSEGIVLFTSNGGMNWITKPANAPIFRDIKFSDNGMGMAAGDGGILKSSDFGINWESIYKDIIPSGIHITSVSFADAFNGILTLSNGDVLTTSNGGLDWTQRQTGASNKINGVIFLDLVTAYAAGDNGKILKSTNGGTDWIHLQSGVSEDLLNLHFINSLKGTVTGKNGRVLQTSDGGLTWSTQNLIAVPLNEVFFLDEINGWIVSDYNFFRTTNGGTNWVEISEFYTNYYVAVHFSDPVNGIVAGGTSFANGTILRTTNSGYTWNASGGSSQVLRDLSFYDALNGIVVGYGCNSCSMGHIARTTNGGATWINEYLGPSFLHRVSYPASNVGIAVGYNVILRNDNMITVPVELISFEAAAREKEIYLTWHTAAEANNRGFEIERKIDSESFLTIGFVQGAGTTTEKKTYSYLDKEPISGLYIYRLKQIDYNGTFSYSPEVQIVFNETPHSFRLEQNYPNPFNSRTIIRYSVPEKSVLSITVYDALGREITKIINEEKIAGNYEVTWDASNLPSGIYFLQLRSDKFIKSSKAILLK